MSLEIQHISKFYGKTQALNDVTVTFEAEKIYGLLGRNGAGKTTLLNLIANRIFTPYGNILLDGEALEENDKALSKLFLVNSDNLYPKHMTVEKAFRLTESFYKEFDIEKAHKFAKQFALHTSLRIGTLSTGYQTIFKDILALSMDLPYVFMDEPALGLDANHRELLYRLLVTEYAENPRTYVLSTHLIDEIANVIENVVILDEGKILTDETCENLLSRGYTATGLQAQIEAFAADKTVIGKSQLGAFVSVNILDENRRTNSVPEGIEITPLDLQKLFVAMTGGAGEEK